MNFFEAAAKEKIRAYQRKPKDWREPVSFIDKEYLALFNY